MVKKSENYQDEIKFVLDENMPFSSIEMLKNKGFYAEHLRFVGLQGATDNEVAEYAKNQKAILVTKDKDFGNPLLYQKIDAPPHAKACGLIGARFLDDRSADHILKDVVSGRHCRHQKNSHHGLIIIRLPYFFTGSQITNTLKSHLNEIDLYSLINKITIIELGRYRQREL